MGPQPFGCGRPANWKQCLKHTYGFNGAATFRLRKVSVPPPILYNHRASMGPQPFGCGRLGPPCDTATPNPASMGPQPFGCGRLNLGRQPVTVPPLQWGRNLSVAEGVASKPGRGNGACFNGAATFRLRKERDGKNL